MENVIEINKIIFVMKHADGQPEFHSTLCINFILNEKTYKYVIEQSKVPHDVDSFSHWRHSRIFFSGLEVCYLKFIQSLSLVFEIKLEDSNEN
jgi:hypothetical protein